MRRTFLPMIAIVAIAAAALIVGLNTFASSAGPQGSSFAGTWRITYGAPTVVEIQSTGGDKYKIVARSPVTLTGGSSCHLPVGTTIATFTGTGHSYIGRHGLWNRSNCVFASWTTVSLALNGNKATENLGNGEFHTLSRSSVARSGKQPSWYLWWLLLLVLLAATIAFFASRRKQE